MWCRNQQACLGKENKTVQRQFPAPEHELDGTARVHMAKFSPSAHSSSISACLEWSLARAVAHALSVRLLPGIGNIMLWRMLTVKHHRPLTSTAPGTVQFTKTDIGRDFY